MARLTPKNQASLVRDLIDFDMRRHGWSDGEKLDYLKIVGDYVDDIGERILSNPPEQDRIELSGLMELVDGLTSGHGIKEKMSVLDAIFEVARPDGETALNPIQFMQSGDCLKDSEAIQWLYERKFTVESNHIHVHPGELCMDMASDRLRWIEPDGVKSDGPLAIVLGEMYEEYRRRERAAQS